MAMTLSGTEHATI